MKNNFGLRFLNRNTYIEAKDQSHIKSYSYDSYIWKSIARLYSIFRKGISWNSCDGNKINFSEDKETEASQSLWQVINVPIHDSARNLLVNFLFYNNTWDIFMGM